MEYHLTKPGHKPSTVRVHHPAICLFPASQGQGLVMYRSKKRSSHLVELQGCFDASETGNVLAEHGPLCGVAQHSNETNKSRLWGRPHVCYAVATEANVACYVWIRDSPMIGPMLTEAHSNIRIAHTDTCISPTQNTIAVTITQVFIGVVGCATRCVK